jgi:hypothetical protein
VSLDGYRQAMEPLFEGRVTLAVADANPKSWALNKWEDVSVGREASAGLHIGRSWVPSRLCQFTPFDRGWVVQLGRARGRVQNKYVGNHVFAPRAAVALQAGRTLLDFPELDDTLRLGIVIGAGKAAGLQILEDTPGAHEREAGTRYAAARIELADSQREVLAVAFLHLMLDQEAPKNLALTAGQRLGKSQQAVTNVLTEVRRKVNRERWLDLRNAEQLGHYLVHLSRNLTLHDLPPGFNYEEGLSG